MRSVGFIGICGVVAICASSACTITAKTQQEFVDSSQPAKTSTTPWTGQPISINNDGVNPLTGTGGIQVTFDPSATTITAKATFAARADDAAHESDADASIADAEATFTIDESNGFAVACHHGQAHGTSGVATSGCKLLQVTLPAGSTTTPLNLTIGNGIGDVTFTGTPVASNLKVQNNAVGDMNVRVQPTVGATLSFVGQFDIALALPAAFTADSVTLTADDPSDITTSFTGMTSGQAFGTTGTGAASLIVTTQGVGAIAISQF